MAFASVTLEGHQRMTVHAKLGESRRSTKTWQVNDEGGAYHFGIELAQQFDCASRRAAGGDEVVDEKHRLAGLERILMYLDDVDAVFELVILADGLPRQPALLANGDKHAAAA